ncbi:hypothetical protein MauCBS54593_006611 [Microsporum audouinii]
MGDPISLASGLITLVGFTLGSAGALFKTIESFRTNKRTIRELKEELRDLEEVLNNLKQHTAESGSELTSLKSPLLRCGNVCKDFDETIKRYTANSGGPRTSFRDWAKLTYMGEDISQFKLMVSGYKSTISIVIGGAVLQRANVNAKVLEEYKTIVADTTSDLKDHLVDIESKLDALVIPGTKLSDQKNQELANIKEERENTKKCLEICAEVGDYIDMIQHRRLNDVSSPELKHATIVTLKGCKDTLTAFSTEMEQRSGEANTKLGKFLASNAGGSEEDAKLVEELQAERDGVKHCIGVCNEMSVEADRVRTNVFEDITSLDDSHLVFISTIGDLISASRITTGARSAHWMGQMSDDSVQQLSKDRTFFAL